MFVQGDYEGAKINFNDAASQAPDAPEPKHYLKRDKRTSRDRRRRHADDAHLMVIC